MRQPSLLAAALGLVLLLPGSAPRQAPQRYLAVVIGVTGYPGYPPARRLKYADRDARAFADYLMSPKGLAVPRANIRLLRNQQASRDSIEDALSWLRQTARSGDVVFFYFAGHGELDERSVAYFQPYEGSFDDPARHGLNMADVVSRLFALPAHVFAYIDACHAGAAGRLARGGPPNIVTPLRTLWDSQTTRVGDPIRMGLASARTNQSSYESDSLQHGLFTWYLLQGLEGNADGIIDNHQDSRLSLAEVVTYVRRRVEQEALREFGDEQVPEPIGEYQGGFVIAMTGAAPPPVRVSAHDRWARAEVARRAGRYREAAAEYRKATEADPQYASAFFGLGLSLEELGDTTGALAAFREATRQNPSHDGAHNNIGHLLMERGDVPGAEVEFRTAVRLAPDWPLYLNNLGAAVLTRGDPDSAEVLFRAAIQRKPDMLLAHRNLGRALRDMGELRRALEAFDAAARLDPDDARTQDYQHQVNDSLQARSRRLAQARDSVRRVPAAWQVLSNALHEDAFDFKGSLDLLLERRRLTPTDRTVRVNLAESYFTAGRFDDAAPLLAQIVGDTTTEARYRIALGAIEVANFHARGMPFSAGLRARRLTRLVQAQPDSFDLNWIFTGTKYYVRTEPRLAPQRRWLIQLFSALEQGRRDRVLAALPSEPAVAQLSWIRCENNSWCGLEILNLDDHHFDDMYGVYVVWVRGKEIVQVGHGFIRSELLRRRQETAVLSHRADGTLLVTWARVPPGQQAGVVRFLADRFHPAITAPPSPARSIPATLPW